MKTYIVQFCLIAGLFLAGCGDRPADDTATTTDESATIELTEDEAAALESMQAEPAEEAEPVTQENYQEALDQLEAEIDSEDQ